MFAADLGGRSFGVLAIRDGKDGFPPGVLWSLNACYGISSWWFLGWYSGYQIDGETKETSA